jgi:predicted ThiF/HesA family dinucleotide-utilizing enzyme
MTEMSAAKNNDLSVIVGGVVALLIGGMIAIAVISAMSADATAAIASIGGLMTMGAAGIFGLAKMRSDVVRTAETLAVKVEETTIQQAAQIAENTALTRRVDNRLNGDLDARMKRIATEAMEDVLERWTQPKT